MLRHMYSYQVGLHFAKPLAVRATRHVLCQGGSMHAWRARLPQRFQRYCRRNLLVRVEKLLGDFERAEFRVPSEDFVVLQKE